MRSYSDEQLVDAVATSRSWRGVLRALGLTATSASAMRSARSHAGRLGLDYSHFTGQRRWSDDSLAAAIAGASRWGQVVEALGLSGGSSVTTLRGHAVRLGIDTSHLTASRPTPDAAPLRPDLTNLARAGTLLAASWFELCGQRTAWPLEPCRYDLVVWRDGRAERIQVKTGVVRTGPSFTVWISSTSGGRSPYDPDEIDQFFIIDGDLNFYLIPVGVVGGLTSIQLSAYQQFRVGAGAGADMLTPR